MWLLYRWVAHVCHRTSVLNVNIDARARCQWSTTVNVRFHMATGIVIKQYAANLYFRPAIFGVKTFRL